MKVSTQGVATGFEPLPADIYRAALLKYIEKRSKAGFPAFNTEWTVISNAAGEDKYEGRKLFISGSLQAHALFTIKRIGVALGVGDDVLEDPEGWDPAEILPDFYSNEVELLVTMSEYNGKPSNNVDVRLEGEGVPAGAGW